MPIGIVSLATDKWDPYTNRRHCVEVCLYTNTAIIPEHLFQRFGGVESLVTATGLVAVLFFCHCCNKCSYMKNQLSGMQYVPSFRSTQDVNTLQERYFRSITDCEVKTTTDRWYVAAIASCCAGFIYPPCFLAVAYCLYMARKDKKGDKHGK